MSPSYQGFCSGQAIVSKIVFRLKVDLELTFIQSGFHGIGNSLLSQERVPHAGIINRKRYVILPGNAVNRHKCPVTHMFNWNRSIVNIVKTPLHHKIIPVCGAFKPGGFKQRLKIVGIVKTLSQEEKSVCAETSADTIVSKLLPYCLCQVLQKQVTGLHSIIVVIHLEVLDV